MFTRGKSRRTVRTLLGAAAAIALQGVLLPGVAHAATGIPGPGDKAPGDPNIAVGLTDIAEVINSQIEVWSKADTSTPLLSETLQSFLGTPAGQNSCGDPEIQYLPANQRWLFTCTDGTAGASYYGVSVALSQTSDPTGAWYRWVGQAQTGMPFLDAPKPLVTSDKLAVYGGPDTGNQDALFVFPLADALAGRLDTPVAAALPNGSQRRFTHKAAVYQNAASVTAAGYFVGNGCSDLGCGFDLLTLSGTPTAPVVTAALLGADPAPGLPAANPAIPGGTADAHLFDVGVINAVAETRTSDGHHVIAYSGQQGCTANTSWYCTYRGVYDLTASQLTIGSSGEPGTRNHLLGSVGIDAAGNLYDSYLFLNPTTAPSAGAAGPGWNATIALSSATTGQTDERFGDYYNAVQDPSDGTKVWFVSAYQTGGDEFAYGTAFACGTAAGLGCGTQSATGPKAQYLATVTTAQTSSIQPQIQLVNTTGAPVPLSSLTVRYWFTRDGGANTYSVTCDYAALGCNNVTESVTNLATPVSGADAYLQVGFTSGAGTLAAAGSTGQVHLRFNKTDWSSFTQTNDYSFSAGTAYADSTAITVYENGTLVWGTPPS